MNDSPDPPVRLPLGHSFGWMWESAMALLLKNLLFTLIVPGTVGVYVPLFLARSRTPASHVLGRAHRASRLGRSVPIHASTFLRGLRQRIFHLFIVLDEEAHLERQFGAEYGRYCANVGRWLPHVHRRPAA